MDQSQEHQESRNEQEYGVYRCSFHPDVETGLACGRCGRYICPRCMVQTPVGSRCPDCARVTKHPTFDVQPSYYFRAVMAGGVVGIVGGVIRGLVLSLHVPFLPWLAAIGMGYLVGEAVSVASNRKRGTGLAVTAGLSTALAAILAMVLRAQGIDIYLLLFTALAIYIAVNRVR